MKIGILLTLILYLQSNMIFGQEPCSQYSNGIYTSFDTEPEMLFDAAILGKTLSAIAQILESQIENLEHKIRFTLLIDENGTTKLYAINSKPIVMSTEQKSEITGHLQTLKWKPASCNNLNVPVYIEIPIFLHLD